VDNYDEDYDPSQDVADMYIDTVTGGDGDFDPTSRLDLDEVKERLNEGKVEVKTKKVYIPLWEREWTLIKPGEDKN